MSTWTEDELRAVGDADELEIASPRPDGTLRPYVIIWVVRVGDELYVRSAFGPDSGWYRRARSSGVGRIRAGGVEKDVVFADAPDGVHAAIDAAYHAKYDHYGAKDVDPVVGDQVAPLTIRLVPRDAEG
jgi:hypothetical protein